MYIKMKNIMDLYPKRQTRLIMGGMENCLTGFQNIKTAPRPFSSHFLYLIPDTALLSDLPDADNMNYLILSEEPADVTDPPSFPLPRRANVLIVISSDEDGTMLILQNYFDSLCGISLFSNSMLDYLFHESGIQSMVDTAFGALQNPIFVFDPTYALIASTTENLLKNAHEKQIIKNGGLDESDFKILNRDHHRLHSIITKQDRPIKAFNEITGFHQLLCAIDCQRDLGHIVVNETNRPFNNIDMEILFLLKKGINQQLQKDEFIRNNRGFNYEHYLKDLLDGKIAIGSQYMDRMDYVGRELFGNLYCLVVETARSANILHTQRIRQLFEKIFPYSKNLNYNGQIIVLICLPPENRLLEKDYRQAQNTCKEYGLYAGISNCFNSIVQIQEYYRQALRAIEIGIGQNVSPGLFIYRNYYMKHMENLFMQKESADTFCHPELKKLFQYDRENSGNLASTLYSYLIHERNIAATASALNTHRNTIVYRLKRIGELTQIDYDDFQERQYLILSYELCLNP